LRYRFGSGRGGLEYDGYWRSNDGASLVRDATYRQWLSIPFTGVLIDRRIVSYSLRVRPVFSQRRSDALPEPIRFHSFDASASARILSPRALSMTIDWSRSSGESSGGFGSSTDFSNTMLTGVVNLRYSVMPMSANITERDSDNTSRVGPNQILLNQSFRTRTMRLNARGRKLDLEAGRTTNNDRAGDGDYEVTNFRSIHLLGWGKGSSIQTRYEVVDRRNRTIDKRRSWSERLRLQHAKRIYTELFFRDNRIDNGNGQHGNHAFSGRFNARTSKVSFGLRGATRKSSFATASQRTIELAPFTTVNTTLGPSIRLRASASVGLSRRRSEGTASFVRLVDQPERFDATGIIELQEPGIDITSIRIRRNDATTEYEEGLDYEVRLSNGIIQIRTLAGGRIQAGDAVLLDYRFRPRLDSREDAVLARASVSLSYRSVTVKQDYVLRQADSFDSTLPSSRGEFDELATVVAANWRHADTGARFEVSQRRRNSETLRYDAYEVSGNAFYTPSRSLRVSFSASARSTADRAGEFRSVSGRPSFTWQVADMVSLRGNANAWRWRDQTGQVETAIGGDLDLNWRMAQTTMTIRYLVERRKSNRTISSHQLRLALIRQF